VGHLVSGAFGRVAANRATESWYDSYYFGEHRERWATARRQLAEMKSAATAAGAKFGVVIFPLLHRLAEKPFARIHDAVSAACAEVGAPCST